MRTISFLSKFMIGFVSAGLFKWTDDIDQNLIKKYSSQRPYMVVKYTIDGKEKTKKLIFDLFWTKKPKTALNFAMLIEGFTDSNNNAYKYKNTKFHRIVKDFVLQGGDITNGNGTGGYSIYGKNFPYENGAVNHVLGSLSMANAGRDTNSSQFFICLKELSYLNSNHPVFGRIAPETDGLEVIKEIAAVDVDMYDVPKHDVEIIETGFVPLDSSSKSQLL